jgi:hypothetical protein
LACKDGEVWWGVRDEDVHKEIGVSELYKIAGGSLVGLEVFL